MKTLAYSLLAAALTGSIIPAIAAEGTATPSTAEVRAKAKDILEVIPDRMPGSETDTPQQIQLGEKLFFEKRLSINQSQSCNTCHAVDNGKAGVDSEPTSPGAFGKRGDRNSPTVLNAGFHFAQFWDGRAATLEDQAKGPILNPVEMAMPDEKVVIERLTADKEYQALFAKAFPSASQKISYDNVAKAIAAFERTLITRDRLDDFLKGNDAALSKDELAGMNTFLEIGCTTCHNGPMIGANTYQKTGLINAYENKKDLGRFDVTKDESDQFKFKVPSLRNIALTGPYFHDGAEENLAKVVEKMAWMQLGRELTPEETKSLVAFLQSMNDKERGAKAPRVSPTT